MAELPKLQPQQFRDININPLIAKHLSPRQVYLAEAYITQVGEKMPMALPSLATSLALFGPNIPGFMHSSNSAELLTNWDLFNMGTIESYVTVYANKDGNTTFSVVNNSKPLKNDEHRTPRSIRRSKVSSFLNSHYDAKIVGRNLTNYLLTRKVGTSPDTIVDGPTDDEPYVVVRKKNGLYVATYEQEDGLYEVEGMVFEPTPRELNLSLHGSVSLLGRKRN